MMKVLNREEIQGEKYCISSKEGIIFNTEIEAKIYLDEYDSTKEERNKMTINKINEFKEEKYMLKEYDMQTINEYCYGTKENPKMSRLEMFQNLE